MDSRRSRVPLHRAVHRAALRSLLAEKVQASRGALIQEVRTAGGRLASPH